MIVFMGTCLLSSPSPNQNFLLRFKTKDKEEDDYIESSPSSSLLRESISFENNKKILAVEGDNNKQVSFGVEVFVECQGCMKSEDTNMIS